VGFEKYFEELGELVHDVDGDPDCESSIANLGARYGLTFHIELVPDLLKARPDVRVALPSWLRCSSRR
jgi:hypothetical protein